MLTITILVLQATKIGKKTKEQEEEQIYDDAFMNKNLLYLFLDIFIYVFLDLIYFALGTVFNDALFWPSNIISLIVSPNIHSLIPF